MNALVALHVLEAPELAEAIPHRAQTTETTTTHVLLIVRVVAA